MTSWWVVSMSKSSSYWFNYALSAAYMKAEIAVIKWSDGTVSFSVTVNAQIFHLFHFFTRIEYQSAIRTSCGSVLLWHGLNFSRGWYTMQSISDEKDWKHVSVQKVVIWFDLIWFWTFAVTLLAWHSICHTSQLVSFRRTNANRQPAFLRTTKVWRNATYLQSDKKFVHFTRQSGGIFQVGMGDKVTSCFLLR